MLVLTFPNSVELRERLVVNIFAFGGSTDAQPSLPKSVPLGYLEGLSIRDTASKLKLGSGTVKSLAHRARHHLRQELSKMLKIRPMRSDAAASARSGSIRA